MHTFVALSDRPSPEKSHSTLSDHDWSCCLVGELPNFSPHLFITRGQRGAHFSGGTTWHQMICGSLDYLRRCVLF